MSSKSNTISLPAPGMGLWLKRAVVLTAIAVAAVLATAITAEFVSTSQPASGRSVDIREDYALRHAPELARTIGVPLTDDYALRHMPQFDWSRSEDYALRHRP